MKNLKLILIASLLFSSLNGNAQWQSYLNIMDSLQVSNDPGSTYLQYLQSMIDSTELDTAESGVGKQLRRSFGFWSDRLPRGEGIMDPLRKYCQAQIAVNPYPCLPKVGDFNGNWENTGPKITNQASGLVMDILLEDQNNYWVGVQFGGLWRVTNGNWNCVTDNILPAGTGVESIVRSPFDSDELYFGTHVDGPGPRDAIAWAYGHGMWKSTNNGSAWTLQTSPGVLDDFSRVSFITYCPNLLTTNQEMMLAVELEPTYPTIGNKLLQKIGAGVWTNITPVGLPPLNVTRIVFPPDQPGVFYISTDAAPSMIAYVYKFTYNTTTGVVGPPIVIANSTTLHQFNFVPNPLAPFYETTNITSAFRYDLAYVGGGKMYIGAAGQNFKEGCWNMLEYQSTAANLPLVPLTSTLISMQLVNNQTRHFMNLAVSSISPNILYCGGLRPFYVSKPVGTNVWVKTDIAYAGQNDYHDDTRCVKILTSVNSNPLGSNDIVFWGNDGGVSMTNGSTCINKNGSNFLTQQIYDVDVSTAGKKRIAAAMHNRMYNTTNNPNLWQNQAQGDGFNSIYDDRTPHDNQQILYYNGNSDPNPGINAGYWDGFVHNNTNAVNNGVPMISPTVANWERSGRSFLFPHGFADDKMYMANRNLFVSQPNSYNPFINTTINGALPGTSTLMYNNCRAIALAPSMPDDRQYFAFKYIHQSPPLPAQSNRKLFVKYQGVWKNITEWPIKGNDRTILDLAVDDNNPDRVFVSLGGVNHGNPGLMRVLVGEFDPIVNTWVFNDMSQGLTELPVVSLVYQHGSDDIIYAGTDAGVYRWDKPLGCWVKFNGTPSGDPMPNVLVHDLEIDYCARKLVMGSYGRGVWETDLYEPAVIPGNTDIITTNTTWGNLTTPTTKYIKGSILIQAPATLTIEGTPNMTTNSSNTTIFMPKYGEIRVEKGAKLVVNGAHITNDCIKNWHGIYAFGDGTQPQVITSGLDAHHGIVEMNKAIIENAEDALNNYGGIDNPNNGGIFLINDSKFYNNMRSVAMLNYFNVNGGVLLPDLSLFQRNTFVVDDNIKDPFLAHVTMWAVRGVGFESNSFINLQNAQTHHREAIYTIDASYKATSNTFTGFYKAIESSQFNFSPPAMLHPIEIGDNHFNENEISIHLKSLNYPRILGNIINVGKKQTPIAPGQTQYFSLGTKMESVSRFKYRYNQHIMAYPPTSGLGQYTAGTEVYNTGANEENIEEND